MADQLLIRAYNVGVGDCIYVRIPKARKKGTKTDDFHILIDCGSKGRADQLKLALDHLKADLPAATGGKKRLDLLIVSHEHEDHIKGMDPASFADLKIENVWMSVAMDRKHPQAKFAHQFHDLAATAMRGIALRGLALSPELQDIVERYGIANDGAIDALTKTLPQQNGIKPLYVHSNLDAADLKPETLRGTTFKVVGPQFDIDHYYLGKNPGNVINAFAAATGIAVGDAPRRATRGGLPKNVTATDFRKLQSRLLSNAFAFAEEEGEVTNNTSIMLIIEWKKRRLLFVGDAEWNRAYAQDKKNFGWNTAWALHRNELDKPVDFLKIGHHGSINSTPWNSKGVDTVTEPAMILDAILPLPKGNAKPRAMAVVSTARTNYKSIPDATLLVDIGRRVKNTKIYSDHLSKAQIADLPNFASYEKAQLGNPQPTRTDFEFLLSDQGFVELLIPPG